MAEVIATGEERASLNIFYLPADLSSRVAGLATLNLKYACTQVMGNKIK